MADIYLHGEKLTSIFELLGADENDITCSIGWALSQSPAFLKAILRRVSFKAEAADALVVRLQEYQEGKGVTDIEVVGDDLHVIIEAKRGWTLPGPRQLRLYAKRLKQARAKHGKLVVLAECSPEFASLCLPKRVRGFPVVYLSWKDVSHLAHAPKGRHAEKRLLHELRTYLRRIVKMQNQESNLVYVVALSQETASQWRVSWIDVVAKKRRYFHPFGTGGWPKEPPNYLGFRYGGRLQSIHHVESAKVVESMHAEIPEIPRGRWGPYVLYKLGKPVIPDHTVKTGNIFMNGRVWAMLDLLLTSSSISEARDKTDQRLADE